MWQRDEQYLRYLRYPLGGAMFFLSTLAACAYAADVTQLTELSNLQQEYFSGNGAAVPDELNLLPYINSANLEGQFALIDQADGVGNRAEIDQAGTANIAGVMEGFGDDNTASVAQNGDSNFAVVEQSGNGNIVDELSQQGNANWVVITQSGAANQINSLLQNGNNNSATVNQYNGNNALSLVQTFDYNQAEIDQYGGTTLNVSQTNAGGSASSINSISIKAYAAPGADPNFGPISVNGAGQMAITLCNPAGSAFCSQYVH
jgi:hypothetical protein